jgi:hypothetical protein
MNFVNINDAICQCGGLIQIKGKEENDRIMVDYKYCPRCGWTNKPKTPEEVIREVKEILQNTEEGSDAETLDEAINDVLDMITEYEKRAKR